MYCVRCGASFEEGSGFCTQCGEPLADAKASSSQQPESRDDSAATPEAGPYVARRLFSSLPGGITAPPILTEAQRQRLEAIANDPEELIDALQAAEGAVRAHAALALAGTDHPQALDALVRNLDDINYWARAAAVLALAQSRHHPSIPKIVHALHGLTGLSKPVRIAAAAALGTMQAQSATDALLEMLHERDEDVSRAACEALAALGGFDPDDVRRRVGSGETPRNIERALAAGSVKREILNPVVEALRRAAKRRRAEDAWEGFVSHLRISALLVAIGLVVTAGTWCYGYQTTSPGGTFTYYFLWGPMALGGIWILIGLVRILFHWR